MARIAGRASISQERDPPDGYQKTFAVPLGLPLAFDKVIEAGSARVVLGNLARLEVVDPVRRALLPALHDAITAARARDEAILERRRSADLASYQALRRHVLPNLTRSAFVTAAMDSADELRVAALLERAPDVEGWVYNHRSGVGYAIEYDWRGTTSRYFPDFIVRAKFGAVFHNLIIEVKGRLDDRDKAKARRGRAYCELLTEHDAEPWHYLLLIESAAGGRTDVSWWEGRSAHEIAHLLRHLEGIPLLPDQAPISGVAKEPTLKLVESVPEDERFQAAVPVFDLAVAAGGYSETGAPFSDSQEPATNPKEPEPIGWARIASGRALDRRMFVAQIVGHSMESAIPDGAWVLFRFFPDHVAPAPTALDGRRLLVQLRDETDPETGGRYTLKRWRVSRLDDQGGADEIELRPDNPDFETKRYTADAGDLRALAEMLEVVG